jgi:histidine triad (HIT) family protein
MTSIFEKIAQREIPAHIFWENDEFMAFLDIRPMRRGHSLVVPKKNHGDYIFELDSDDYQKLMAATKEVAEILKEKLKCERVFMWVQGLEVPHVHVHLIPGADGVDISDLKSGGEADQDLEAVFNQLK